jgi:hypothetical protein
MIAVADSSSRITCAAFSCLQSVRPVYSAG